MTRLTLSLDEEKDFDILELMRDISKPHKGAYLKEALRLGIHPIKDMDLYEGLPNLGKPYHRHELVKEALRFYIKFKHGNRAGSNGGEERISNGDRQANCHEHNVLHQMKTSASLIDFEDTHG